MAYRSKTGVTSKSRYSSKRIGGNLGRNKVARKLANDRRKAQAAARKQQKLKSANSRRFS